MAVLSVYLINNQDGHNKYWYASTDGIHNKVVIRWGRLGTKGQEQTKEFSTEYAARGFISSKSRDKLNNGYKPSTKTEFEQETIIATIIGSSNKCTQFHWVKVSDELGRGSQPIPGTDIRYTACTEEELINPETNPGIYIELETKKSFHDRNQLQILLTGDHSYDLITGEPITQTSEIYQLVKKLEEAIGRRLVGE